MAQLALASGAGNVLFMIQNLCFQVIVRSSSKCVYISSVLRTHNSLSLTHDRLHYYDWVHPVCHLDVRIFSGKDLQKKNPKAVDIAFFVGLLYVRSQKFWGHPETLPSLCIRVFLNTWGWSYLAGMYHIQLGQFWFKHR